MKLLCETMCNHKNYLFEFGFTNTLIESNFMVIALKMTTVKLFLKQINRI